ncbi:MAG: serine protease, partial [Oligoflexia bacterium]|nr:serine protease [Oligoflexia bacterium]
MRNPLFAREMALISYLALAVGALVAVPMALAASAPAVSVVKVESQSCLSRRNLKVGSGTLIRSGSAMYVLTSDHALYHGGSAEGLCHRVLWNGSPIRAELRGVQVFKGLGLLELQGRIPEAARAGAIELTAIAPAAEGELTGSFGTLLGVPGAGTSVLRSGQAQMLSARGTRRPLPGIPFMIEAKGHSEFGMSGGALLDSHGGFAGVISHQYLRLELGAPSTLHPYEEGARPGELIALVIP